MKAEWKSFLTGNGAEFDGAEQVLHFGSLRRELSMAMNGTVFADLSYQGLLAVRGADAQDFLQGQFTNDLRSLDATQSQLNGYCSPKGRLLATFRVIPETDGYLLGLPRNQLEAVSKRLKMFILRSAVTVEDASDRYVRMGVSGPQAIAELQDAINTLPDAVDRTQRSGDYLVVRIPGAVPYTHLRAHETLRYRVWLRLLETKKYTTCIL